MPCLFALAVQAVPVQKLVAWLTSDNSRSLRGLVDVMIPALDLQRLSALVDLLELSLQDPYQTTNASYGLSCASLHLVKLQNQTLAEQQAVAQAKAIAAEQAAAETKRVADAQAETAAQAYQALQNSYRPLLQMHNRPIRILLQELKFDCDYHTQWIQTSSFLVPRRLVDGLDLQMLFNISSMPFMLFDYLDDMVPLLASYATAEEARTAGVSSHTQRFLMMLGMKGSDDQGQQYTDIDVQDKWKQHAHASIRFHMAWETDFTHPGIAEKDHWGIYINADRDNTMALGLHTYIINVIRYPFGQSDVPDLDAVYANNADFGHFLGNA